MKNRELFNEKMKLVGELILRIVVYFVITIIFYIVVLDALLGSFLGNTLYKINYELYYWCVNSKEEIFMIYIISILIFVQCMLNIVTDPFLFYIVFVPFCPFILCIIQFCVFIHYFFFLNFYF